MLIRILALTLVISTPALARGYDRPDIIRGLCRPDGCDEFSVVSARPLASSEEGTLMRTRLKTFHASRNGRKDLGEEDGYVYCSRTSPAILADRDVTVTAASNQAAQSSLSFGAGGTASVPVVPCTPVWAAVTTSAAMTGYLILKGWAPAPEDL